MLDDVESPLLANSEADEPPARAKESVTVLQLLRARDLYRPLAGVCLLFLAQQISGDGI
jgi:hypothetical protein